MEDLKSLVHRASHYRATTLRTVTLPLPKSPSVVSLVAAQTALHGLDDQLSEDMIVDLRRTSATIRDTIDPMCVSSSAVSTFSVVTDTRGRLSQDSGTLTADNALDLMDLFAKLRKSRILVQDLRTTRAHKALLVVDRADTHWPEKLVEAASGVLDVWTRTYGPLDCIRPDLFGAGSRLEGVADPNELNTDARRSNHCCREAI